MKKSSQRSAADYVGLPLLEPSVLVVRLRRIGTADRATTAEASRALGWPYEA